MDRRDSCCHRSERLAGIHEIIFNILTFQSQIQPTVQETWAGLTAMAIAIAPEFGITEFSGKPIPGITFG